MVKKKLLIALTLFVFCCAFAVPNFAQAASSVTLATGPFTDSDAEDTHNATQWVVRDSGSTAYDSGADTTNLTSITISGAFFVSGTTYYWKARFRDQHFFWGAYSDEVSFVYSDGAPTPTPTPTPSSTVTSTSTGTPTPEVTTTTTVTTTVSASTTLTITSTITVSPKTSSTVSPGGSQTPVLYGTSSTPPGWGGSSTTTANPRHKYIPGVDLVAGIDPVYPKLILASASLVAASIETFTGLLYGSRLISAISTLFSRFFRIIPWRRRKTKWGYVYDAISKDPIPGVQVRIYSEPSGRSRQVQYTQNDGSFGFVVPNGLYSLTALKEHYNFPSTLLHSKNDGLYENLYYGEEIEIGINKSQDKTDEFKLSIPLDSSGNNVTDMVGADLLMKIRKFFDVIRMPVLIIGTVFTVYLVIRFDYIYDLFLLALYAAIWFYEIYSRLKPRTYGQVIDDFGRGVASAVVRVINASGRIIATTVTSEDGHFRASLEKGTFIFEATKVGFSRERTGLLIYHKPGDLSRVNIKIKKVSRQDKNLN